MTNIKTISFGFKGNANAIEIILEDYKLGIPPRLLVKFFDAQETEGTDVNNEPVTNYVYMHEEFLDMTEEVYENWGTDDQVVVDFVLETLELTEA